MGKVRNHKDHNQASSKVHALKGKHLPDYHITLVSTLYVADRSATLNFFMSIKVENRKSMTSVARERGPEGSKSLSCLSLEGAGRAKLPLLNPYF